ncbi:MAG: hypothetical protein WA150_11055 [Methylovirgula sp.]
MSVFLGLLASVIGWFGINFIGKPILKAEERRIEILRLGERYSSFGMGTDDDRAMRAIKEINDALALVKPLYRSSLIIRIYCRIRGYNFPLAEGILNGISHMIGRSNNDNDRLNQIDALYLALNATEHLPKKRVHEINEIIREAKQIRAA